MRLPFRHFASLVLTVALGAAFGPISQAQAQKYPDHPVKIDVPFAAAGPTDVMARLIADKLSQKLGQQFYVENRPGAGGNTGTSDAAKSEPDGYTIAFVSSSFVVNPSLYKRIPFDALKDFIPVTMAASTPNVLVVHPSVPAKSVEELIALIKKQPDKYSNYANPGIGTTPQLSGELFRLALKLDLVGVPFKGAGPAIQSTVAGHTNIAFTALPPTTAQIKNGALRALAVTSKKRSSALPDVPTLDELGIKDQEAETMQGVLVPAGTPKQIVDLLQKEIAAIVAMPDVKAKMQSLGFEPAGNSSAEFTAYIKSEIAKWKKVIADAKIKQI
jgi:tripartite-type tricarboxylate transporter receptor subunit TctC